MKVYLVTDGDYSDYRVLCVCSTPALGARAQELYNAQNQVEEFELDRLPETPPGLLPYKVGIRQNGDIVEISRVGIDDYIYEFDDKLFLAGQSTVLVTVWARDTAHAVKIAGERRSRALAERLED